MKIPGSKSILQRLMLLMAYQKTGMEYHNYNPCSDVLELETALKICGYRAQKKGNTRSFHFCPDIHQDSKHNYRFEQNATGFRFWLSFLASIPGQSSTVWASDTLLHRGYAPLTQALQAMGAKINLNGNLLEISGSHLCGGPQHLGGDISSQYASSLILASGSMAHTLQLQLSPHQVSQSYIELTLQTLELFGGRVQKSATLLEISADQLQLPASYTVDSDMSSLAYYAVLAALDTDTVIFKVRLNPKLRQPDMVIFDFMRKMGVGVRRGRSYVKIIPGPLSGSVFDLRDCPDLMPVLSILALFCDSPSTLQNIGRLSYKESNRSQGITKALDLIDAEYDFDGENLKIFPYQGSPLELTLDAQNDHRLVMAFSLLKSRFPSIRINDTSALAKSFPFSYEELIALK